ncbi:MAG: methenyltetrahydromethanopterin cyclohydrolase [Planctomycetota bacterium]|nr:methenyltetrahydromethanopterin cyclohydrolase [Planctomycetota bacterium]MDA1180167.1 methenyltetrahydromethanopterin cyclohydrolase [Planctomycetota bacterium]
MADCNPTTDGEVGTLGLNRSSWDLCCDLPTQSERLRVQRFSGLSDEHPVAGCWDFGLHAPGGLQAGLLLARVCLGGLGEVFLAPPSAELGPWPLVTVSSDCPIAACLAAQYAGWKMNWDGFFAMGSGPMRAAAGSESLFDTIGYRESPDRVVGVCESGQAPTQAVVQRVAEATHVKPDGVLLLFAPTRSIAGSLQVVARSIETALHQLHERGGDLTTVVSAFGTAPLPPVAASDIHGIGRTNDAILYGSRVTIWMRAADEQLSELSAKINSSASPDYGQPFAEIFAKYGHDFYRVDPHLFAPAEVHLVNLLTGRTFSGGKVAPEILAKSFHS